jgi:hypothetical protein
MNLLTCDRIGVPSTPSLLMTPLVVPLGRWRKNSAALTGLTRRLLTTYGTQAILGDGVATVIDGDFEWDDEKVKAGRLSPLT